jgi:cyclopropane-fatty-acyl-phospholipid synthase
VTRRAAAENLADTVTVRQADYRDLDAAGQFDAVAAVEMGEHVGEQEYPGFADLLFRSLRPGGRALIQQMSRTGRDRDGGPFIRTWIAPDMHMKPLSETIGALISAGLEVRDVQAMREHYARTIDAWARNLDTNWQQAVCAVGVEAARVWQLYLAGSSLAFTENRMGVDQILVVRPAPDGTSGMSTTPMT